MPKASHDGWKEMQAEPALDSSIVAASGSFPNPRVMHVITDLDVGGAERMLVSYLTADRTDSGETMVVSLLHGGLFAETLNAAGYRVGDLGMGRVLANLISPFRLARLIRHEKPDVIQSWMYHADLVTTLALLLSGRRRETRFYWGVRCSDMDTSKYHYTLRFVIWACAWLSWLPNGVIANSYAGRNVHQALGYRARNFSVIPNGVDIERFRPDPELRHEFRKELDIPEDVVAIAMVARVDPMKDHAKFLSAIASVPDVIGVVAGRGTENLPDSPRLRRLGMRHDIERVYAGCDAVVLCSAFGEGFPNVLVEGMASGLPPVVTDVGDSAMIVDGVGTVVPASEGGEFLEAIRGLADQGQDRLLERGRDARGRVAELYSLDRAVTAFDDIYQQVAVDDAREAGPRPLLAIGSAIVSRLATFGALIAAARLLEPVEFGAFAVMTAISGIVNALVSGGGDMWLNSFTASESQRTLQAPRVSRQYLMICSGLAALALIGFGGVLAVGLNSGVGLGPLNAYPFAMFLAVLGACLAGLFESLLAVLRAGSRVTMFFTLRDLTTPIIILGLIIVLRPTSAVTMIGVYTVVWAVVFFGAFGYLMGLSKVLPRSARTSSKRWRTLLRHTGGLVYGNFGSRLSIYIDVLVLTYVVSLDQVGEYRAAAQFAIGFMVVQHFVFLGLPWQMRRVGQAGKPGPGYLWVDNQQRMLLLLAGVATVLLWLLAGPILSLLGDRFVDMAPLFRLFVLIRFVDLLWGPNHEMLVSNGRTMQDAHANLVSLGVWMVTFWAISDAGVSALTSAVAATAFAALTGQALRYRMLRHADLIPVMGHRYGPAFPVAMTCGVLAATAVTL